ncbi:MAG: tetratricopeptide repeat protein [Nitrospirota bacterium]|nr:tetratricopeptide repeat protein [Nitrospirota bacterium]
MRSAECGVRNKLRVTKTGLLCVMLLLCAAGSGHAADDAVQKAMKAYEKHRYEEGARDLRQTLSSLPQNKQSAAQLALGMLYLKNAELHQGLFHSSVVVNADYLNRLARERGSSRSKYSDLYLGLTLLESGKPENAAAPLEKFLAGTAEKKHKAFAAIGLGMVEHHAGNKQKAQDAWNAVQSSDQDVKTELAFAWSRAVAADKNAPALCDEVLAAGRKSGAAPSIIAVKNCLGVYAAAGLMDKGMDLLQRGDLKSHAYRESAGRSKVISFYDVQLLASLAKFYLAAATASLEHAAADAQLRSIANYYLSEASVLEGSADQAAKAATAFLASPQAPPQYKNRAMVRQGLVQYQKGKKADAIGLWDELTRNQPNDPELLADVLFACGRLSIECPRPAQTAASAVERGEGKRFAVANIGLGRYYVGRKDYARALTYLETGRDKGNKNKIEFNDPLMLVDLAEAYYRTKKYSEALEIYFEMSKQFPQVRQLQEALQGIYSMEHKSAGDVKIN